MRSTRLNESFLDVISWWNTESFIFLSTYAIINEWGYVKFPLELSAFLFSYDVYVSKAICLEISAGVFDKEMMNS